VQTVDATTATDLANSIANGTVSHFTAALGTIECTQGHGLFVTLAAKTVRVVGESALSVRVFPARYDRLISDGTVSVTPTGRDCLHQDSLDGNVCVSVNSQNCQTAAGPLPIYSGSTDDGKVQASVTCANCYFAFSADVNVHAKMTDFLMWDAHIGLSNVHVSGALVAGASVSGAWAVDADALLDMSSTKSFQLWAGPLPIVLSLGAPLRRTASASLNAQAHGELGATFGWELGDMTMRWNPLGGWSADVHEPGLTYNTVVSGSATLDGRAQLGFDPSVVVTLDSFFTGSVSLDTEVLATVNGATATDKLCAAVNYTVDAAADASIHINVPWIHLDKSWSWHETLYQRSGSIAAACVAPSNGTAVPLAKRAALPFGGELGRRGVVATATTATTARSSGRSGVTKPMPTSELLWHSGQVKTCMHGMEHALDYRAGLAANLVNIDELSGIKKIRCNGQSSLELTFHHGSEMDRFIENVTSSSLPPFFTGNHGWNSVCAEQTNATVFLRRMLYLEDVSLPFQHVLQVGTAAAGYDDVLQEGSLVLSPTATECGNTLGEDVGYLCEGFNVNAQCTGPAAQLPIMTSDLLDVTCTSCYAGVRANFFLNVSIHDFHLHNISAGISEVHVEADLTAAARSSKAASAGQNVTVDLVPPTTIFDVALGPLPLRLWFAVPVQRAALAHASEALDMSAGATASLDLGAVGVEYVTGSGWSTIKPGAPTLAFTENVGKPSGNAQLDVSLQLAPTLALHLDNIFEMWVSVDPHADLHATVNVDGQACVNGTASTQVYLGASLDISVPEIDLKIYGHLGPEVVYDSGVKELGKCLTI